MFVRNGKYYPGDRITAKQATEAAEKLGFNKDKAILPMDNQFLKKVEDISLRTWTDIPVEFGKWRVPLKS